MNHGISVIDYRNILYDYIYGSRGRTLKDIYNFTDNLKIEKYKYKYINWSLRYLLRKNLIVDIGSDNNHFYVEV